MIVNLLSNHPWIGPFLLTVWQTVELYLGMKKPMDAGSVPQLLWRFTQYIASFFHSSSTKGATMASANPHTVTLSVVVDGPTYEALGVITDILRQIAGGSKPQDVVSAALPRIIGALSQLSQIPEDLSLDRASVVEAVSQRLGDLGESFILARTSAVAVAAK